jgi:hypothetical protein
MAKYILQIPANYAGRVGGNRQVSIEASSPSEAKTKVVEAGIPAAVLGTPVEIKGQITSGSLPPDVSQYALPVSGSERSAVLRGDRIIGANNPALYSRLLAGEDVGGELVSGTPFAPNINPAPTAAQIQAAIPFTAGTPGDPFYQPPSYQPMTTADFAQIRADQDAAERAKIEQELLNLDAAEIANIEAAVRRQLADRRAQELINASAALNFNNEEGSIAGGLFRDSDISDDSGNSDGPDGPDGPEPPKDPGPSDAIPANLPKFWRERYDEYLLLTPYLQRVILENQIKDYIELEPYRGEGIYGGASIENLFTREPGSVADIALASVFDPSKGPVGGTNLEVRPPEGYVPPSRIPDPLQLQGYANTGLQDILNIFYANPDRYISEIPLFEERYNPDTEQIERIQVGTQQVLSPVAQAALQAFSTQRGAESADIASRFGTATPFGAIAGLGGTAEQAVGLAELQARAGVTNPYAALGTGSGIGDISQILRGGLTAEEQLNLAGLQARGGLTAQERLAEQRLAALSPLLQASPGTLGGLSRVLGGEAQLQGLFSPFTSDTSATGMANVMQQTSPTPFTTQSMERPRQTIGDYQSADLFDRGAIEAEAGMAGEELDRYLGQVSLGAGSPRGSLGAQLA